MVTERPGHAVYIPPGLDLDPGGPCLPAPSRTNNLVIFKSWGSFGDPALMSFGMYGGRITLIHAIQGELARVMHF